MLHIVLFQPEIPQNTGNIGRTCAYTGCQLHLIRPFGFKLNDSTIKRSGMDYWHDLNVQVHESWDDFIKSDKAPKRLWLLTTKANKDHWDADFKDGDGLVFGNEGHGAPDYVHKQIGKENSIKLPQFKEGLRSLNLATSAGIACYEALRQVKGI